jgi:putative ABC transport system permease protein
MLRNYLNVAFRVLGRNLFFTFISLFGVSFTLLILMLIAGYLKAELGGAPPLGNKDKIVSLSAIKLEYVRPDTILSFDTTMVEGAMQIDTIRTPGEPSTQTTSQSAMSRDFLKKYLSDVNGAERQTFYSSWQSFDLFINGGKLTVPVVYADPAFWEIFNFQLLEGRFWSEADMEQAARVAVITEELALKYFGRKTEVAGQEMEMDGKQFTVAGVVKKGTSSFNPVTAQAYLPHSIYQEPLNSYHEYIGYFQAVFMGKDAEDLRRNLAHRASQIPLPNSDFNVLKLEGETYAETITQNIVYDENPVKGKRIVLLILISLIGLFTLLPALNLVNLNTSRMMERSGEIGVRKAFGAHSGNILAQFVVENVVLTLIGGVIALLLSIPVISAINNSRILGEVSMEVDLLFWLYGLLIALGFGVLTGLLPAWRMARAHIVESLKYS